MWMVIIYFDSFGVEHISKKIQKFKGNINITNIYRIQAYVWIMCGYFCIGIGLLDYTNLFSPNDYETNDKIKLKG